MDFIQNGYFMHEGLIVCVKILTCEGIENRNPFRPNITILEQNKYEYIDFDNCIYLSKEFKIQSCEDIFGKSKGIQSVKKFINSQDNFTLKFRINKEVVLSECIDYLFFKKGNPFKMIHCGNVKLYDKYGILREEYFNNNGKYEDKRKIYENLWNVVDNEYVFVKSFCKYEYNYIDGKKNGLEIKYVNSITKEYEYNYIDGMKNGLQIHYYAGRKTHEYYCINDKIEGIYKRYVYYLNVVEIEKKLYENDKFIKYI